MSEILVRRLKKPNVKVRGTVTGQVQCPPESLPEGDEWSEVQLWTTESGAWAAIGLRPAANLKGLVGEVQLIRTPKIVPPGGMLGLDGNAEDGDHAQRIMINAVMEFFGWSWLAKGLAAKLGWQIEQELE